MPNDIWLKYSSANTLSDDRNLCSFSQYLLDRICNVICKTIQLFIYSPLQSLSQKPVTKPYCRIKKRPEFGTVVYLYGLKESSFVAAFTDDSDTWI
jgi:hypothetical protein